MKRVRGAIEDGSVITRKDADAILKEIEPVRLFFLHLNSTKDNAGHVHPAMASDKSSENGRTT